MLNIIEKGFSLFVYKDKYEGNVKKYALKAGNKDLGIVFNFHFDEEYSRKDKDKLCLSFCCNEAGYIPEVHKAYKESETRIWWEEFTDICGEMDVNTCNFELDEEEPEDVLSFFKEPDFDFDDYEEEEREYVKKILENGSAIHILVYWDKRMTNGANLLNYMCSPECKEDTYLLHISSEEDTFVPVVKKKVLASKKAILNMKNLESAYTYSDFLMGAGLTFSQENKFVGMDYLALKINLVNFEGLMKRNPRGKIKIKGEKGEEEARLKELPSFLEEIDEKNIEIEVEETRTPHHKDVRMIRDIYGWLGYPDEYEEYMKLFNLRR